MTGVAPEPADRAVARVLSGGLDDWRDTTDTAATPFETARGRTFEGYAGQLAHDLAGLLNRAVEHGVAICPVTDPGDGHRDALYSVEGATGTCRSDWVIEYDTATGRWNAAAD